MNDSWFDEYMFEIAAPRSMISPELLAAQGKNGMAGAAVVGPRLPMPERRRVLPFELAFGLQ